MGQDILVSILVASYNSGKYILDLLESIKEQTYRRIELVIADDASKDDSISIVEKWLETNQQRFERVEILAPKENHGTSYNMNQGLQKCNGKYIKIIAADDMLLPTCIEDCVNVCEEQSWEVVIGDVQRVEDDGKTLSAFSEDVQAKKAFYNADAKEQYRQLLKQNSVTAPAAFYAKEFLVRYKGFDERFGLIEDYPFWLKVTSDGVKLNYLDKKIVLYRMSSTSVAFAEKAVQIFNEKASRNSRDILYKLRFKGLLKNKEYRILLRNMRRFFIRDLVILCGNNRKNLLCRLFVRFE